MPNVEPGKKKISMLRWWTLPLSILLAVVVSVGMVRGTAPSLAAQGPAAAGTWLRVTTNLSASFNLLSAYPDVAVSSNGQYVAVVWQEQHTGDTDVKTGHIYIRCVQEGSDQWWSAKDSVPGSYVIDVLGRIRGQTPAVALYGNQVHVVWSGGYEPNYNTIYYQKGTIGANNAVTWVSNTSAQKIASLSGGKLTNPDIAVDGSGNPRVVWQQENASGAKQIYYRAHDGSAWQSSQQVSNGTGTGNKSPAIAVWDTTAHVAWVAEENVGTGYGRNVFYSNSTNWTIWRPLYDAVEPEEKAVFPSIAVTYDDGKDLLRIGVAWDRWYDNVSYGTVDGSDEWELYYRYSEDGGNNWKPPPPLLDSRVSYLGDYDFFPHAVGGTEYVQSVRPSLIYDSGQIPHMAVSETEGSFSDSMATYHYEYGGDSWSSEIMPWDTSKSGERGAARLVIGEYGDEDHLHYVYQSVVGTDAGGQSRWDVFYTSNARYNSLALPLITKQAVP